LVLGSLTLKEFALQKKIFKFFDQNEDGFISEDELKGACPLKSTRVFLLIFSLRFAVGARVPTSSLSAILCVVFFFFPCFLASPFVRDKARTSVRRFLDSTDDQGTKKPKRMCLHKHVFCGLQMLTSCAVYRCVLLPFFVCCALGC